MLGINVCKSYYGGVQSNHVKPLSVAHATTITITVTKRIIRTRRRNSRHICVPFSGYKIQLMAVVIGGIGAAAAVAPLVQASHIYSILVSSTLGSQRKLRIQNVFQCFRMIDFIY